MAEAKKIIAVKPSGEVAGYFDCIADVKRHYPTLNLRNIRKSLNQTRRRAYGFRWMLLEEYRQTLIEKGETALSYETDKQRDIHGRFVKGSAARKGLKPYEHKTEEWKEQHKEQMRELAKKRFADPNDNWGKVRFNGKPLRDLTTGKVYANGQEWSKDTGLGYWHISRAIKCGYRIYGHRLERISKETYNELVENGKRTGIEAV